MEIKDLATKVELGTEMATVRGGGRWSLGNVDIRRIKSFNKSTITNGDVYADTTVKAQRSNGASFDGVGSYVEYAPMNDVAQTSSVAIDLQQHFDGLNFTS
jgi:hypothetical protein